MYLTRLPTKKADKHLRKKVTTLGTLADEITDFATSTTDVKRKRKRFDKVKGKRFKRKCLN